MIWGRHVSQGAGRRRIAAPLAAPLALAVGALLAAASASGASGAEPDRTAAEPEADWERVIVQLDVDVTPEHELAEPARHAQRQAVDRAADRALEALEATQYRIGHRYYVSPGFSAAVSPQARAALERSPRVATVVDGEDDELALADTAEIVQFADTQAEGHGGDGQVIAVLDTGVESDHPFLDGRVVEEACYSTAVDGPGGHCPNGQAAQTGPGSGEPCDFAGNCYHGTAVAGVAAGDGDGTAVSFNGVADEAGIMAIQAARETTDGATFAHEDQIAALERVYELRDVHDFAAVNMSLSGGAHTSPCEEDVRAEVIANLWSVGIPVVGSTGNAGEHDAIGAPACVPEVVSVGATTKADEVDDEANVADFMDVFAPTSVQTADLDGGWRTLGGTSGAAPHVAGSLAVLQERFPNEPLTERIDRLTDTGLPVTDERPGNTGVTAPRVRLGAAAEVPYEVDIEVTGPGSLSVFVDSMSRPSCFDACSMTEDGGVTVALWPHADSGSEFVGWGGDLGWDDACEGAEEPCEFALVEDAVVTAEFAEEPDGEAVRANANGPEYVDGDGVVWEADQAFVPGEWGHGTVYASGSTSASISGTDDDELYQSWNEFDDWEGYTFEVPDGQYEVTLRMMEDWATAPGHRVFDVRVNGSVELAGYDVFDECGPHAACDETVPVDVTDGEIEVEFSMSGGVGYAVVSAIDVVQID